MSILAEISDKMPSTVGIIVVAVMAGGICCAIARASRLVAWSMLGITLFVGGILAYEAVGDAFSHGPMRDAVWSEMGWPWVVADIIGPLLPAVGVAGILLFRRWPTQAPCTTVKGA